MYSDNDYMLYTNFIKTHHTIKKDCNNGTGYNNTHLLY